MNGNPHQKLDETISIYRKLIAQNPNTANLHFLLGKALMDRGLDNEALVSLRRSIALDATNAEAHGRLGHLLVKQYKLLEGASALRQSVELMPQNSRLFYYLFQALHKAGKLESALVYLRRAVDLNPLDLEVHTALLGTLLYLPEYSPEQMLSDRRLVGQRMETQWAKKWHQSKTINLTKRLKVGFISADLGAHPVGFFLESVFHELRNLNSVDIVVYAPDGFKGAITDRIRSATHAWVSISALSDDMLEQRIRSDKIDILIDLSGHTAFNRLTVFARKPAPIQITWLGDCATTGLSAIDYIFCDTYGVREGEEKFYTEKPWVLPNTRLCFTPPIEKPLINELPALNAGHITFGCFNALIKMNDKVVALWARILTRVPNSSLMLKSLSFHDENVRKDVIARFVSRGVSQERLSLTFGKVREEYFADYNFVDMALDPFPFTGGTTSIDGIWMGVPFITLRGNTMGSRQGEGILCNLGMDDWIAADEDAYVELAVEKSKDVSSLSKLRKELRDRLETSPLCDAKLFARNLENAFQLMWKTLSENS